MARWSAKALRDVPMVAKEDPAVMREARALEVGTTVVALGGEPRDRFESSWQSHHFEGVPRA
jgi:hypothetical protein